VCDQIQQYRHKCGALSNRICEIVSGVRNQPHACIVPTRQNAKAVMLDFVEFLATPTNIPRFGPAYYGG